jgi:arylsulfatase A-like enzyme
VLWSERTPPDPLSDPVVDPDLVRLDLVQLRDVFVPPPERPRPAGGDIALIVLDTVRADRLGLYGYDRATTPKLDAWAAGARVYTEMVADGAWTIPSHASMFTGLAPATHGARGLPRNVPGVAAPLPPELPTVPEALQQAGYHTVGIAANRAFLHPGFGLARGFDVWLNDQLEPDPRCGYLEAARVSAMALEVMRTRSDRPLFLFLNYMDAHAPWIPRRGYVREGAVIDRDTLPYREGFDAAAHRLMGPRERDPAVLASWSEAYDAELRYLDAQLAPVLDALSGFSRVIVLSDHGEYLGEHDLVEHSKDVYEEVLRVPLIVRGEPAGRDATPIQHHDVAGMLLTAAGLPPFEGMQRTVDLQVSELYWTRKKDLDRSYGRRFDRVRRAFRLGPQKLILSSDGKDEAYDLTADPREATNLRGAPWVAPLRLRADAWVEGHPVRAAEGAEGGDMKALEALGYVDGR